MNSLAWRIDSLSKRNFVALSIGICAFITGLCYHSRLDAFFFQDDLAMIAHGADCWQTYDILRLFSTDQYDIAHYNRLRPVVLSIYTLIYRTFGLDAGCFRMLNVVVHGATGCLLVWFARQVTSRSLAWVSAGIFLSWPTLSNAVFPICTLTDLLAGGFTLATICWSTHLQRTDADNGRWYGVPLLGLLYLLGQFSKETAICTGPLLILAGRFAANRSWRHSFLASLPVGLLSVCYLGWRHHAFGVFLTGSKVPFFSGGLYEWLRKYLAFSYELATGTAWELTKIALPPGIAPLIAAALGLLSLAGLWLALQHIRHTGLSRASKLGLAFFAVAVLPVSYYPMARNLYIPVMGLSLVGAQLCALLTQRFATRAVASRLVLAGFVALAAFRVVLLDLHCRNDGKAGDLFATLVTELDALSHKLPAGASTVALIAQPVEMTNGVYADTPWIICGGDAGYYQQLKYGKRLSNFKYF